MGLRSSAPVYVEMNLTQQDLLVKKISYNSFRVNFSLLMLKHDNTFQKDLFFFPLNNEAPTTTGILVFHLMGSKGDISHF